jgi:hypothetical protein
MGEAYSVVIDGAFMRRIVLVLAVLSGRLRVVNTQAAKIPAEKSSSP